MQVSKLKLIYIWNKNLVKLHKNLNKKGENIKFLNNLNKQLLKKQKQKTI